MRWAVAQSTVNAAVWVKMPHKKPAHQVNWERVFYSAGALLRVGTQQRVVSNKCLQPLQINSKLFVTASLSMQKK